MEHYVNKLMEIVSSDSNRISYDQRELALGMNSIKLDAASNRSHVILTSFFIDFRGDRSIMENTWLTSGIVLELRLRFIFHKFVRRINEIIVKGRLVFPWKITNNFGLE